MDEAGVRRVAFVRAFEEERDGRRFLDPAECAAAGREARVEAGEDLEAFLRARADRLMASLRDRLPGVEVVEGLAGTGGPRLALLFAVTLLLGVVVDRAGGGRFLNLLAFPLIGMVAWNLVVYLLLIVAALRGSSSDSTRRGTSGWLIGPASWISAPERPWSRWRRVADVAGSAAHAQEFLADWTRLGAPLHRARVQRALHVGAAGLVLGAVVGMYLRGLVFEYRVGWESTFLDAEGVHRFLSVVLAPGLAAGIGSLPDVEGLRALQGAPESGASENAATWIHLYAFTALCTVLVPRLFLALFQGARVRRLSRELPVRWDLDPWALRLQAGERGGAVEVRPLVYAHRFAPRAADGLKSFALDMFGNRAALLDREELEYGDEYGTSPSSREERCELVVFNLAQTPEPEVHGAFCRDVLAQAAGARGKRAVLVIVDESGFLERLGDDEESRERVEARRRNWSRVLRDVDVEGVFLDLGRHVSNEALASARDALWPGPLEVAR